MILGQFGCVINNVLFCFSVFEWLKLNKFRTTPGLQLTIGDKGSEDSPLMALHTNLISLAVVSNSKWMLMCTKSTARQCELERKARRYICFIPSCLSSERKSRFRNVIVSPHIQKAHESKT